MSKRRYQQRHNCITVIPTDEKSPTKNFKMDTLAFTEDNYLQDEILDDIKQGTIAPCSQPEKQIKLNLKSERKCDETTKTQIHSENTLHGYCILKEKGTHITSNDMKHESRSFHEDTNFTDHKTKRKKTHNNDMNTLNNYKDDILSRSNEYTDSSDSDWNLKQNVNEIKQKYQYLIERKHLREHQEKIINDLKKIYSENLDVELKEKTKSRKKKAKKSKRRPKLINVVINYYEKASSSRESSDEIKDKNLYIPLERLTNNDSCSNHPLPNKNSNSTKMCGIGNIPSPIINLDEIKSELLLSQECASNKQCESLKNYTPSNQHKPNRTELSQNVKEGENEEKIITKTGESVNQESLQEYDNNFTIVISDEDLDTTLNNQTGKVEDTKENDNKDNVDDTEKSDYNIELIEKELSKMFDNDSNSSSNHSYEGSVSTFEVINSSNLEEILKLDSNMELSSTNKTTSLIFDKNTVLPKKSEMGKNTDHANENNRKINSENNFQKNLDTKESDLAYIEKDKSHPSLFADSDETVNKSKLNHNEMAESRILLLNATRSNHSERESENLITNYYRSSHSHTETDTYSTNTHRTTNVNFSKKYFNNYNQRLMDDLEKKMFDCMHGKFKVTSLIRNGQFAKIYKVCDRTCGRNYAIKLPKNNISFKNNMLVYNNNRHDSDVNIINIYKRFSLRQQWCSVMEYYPKNLIEALKRQGTAFHIDHVQILAKQLVSAVTFMRSKKIVHSHINPSHVLLNDSNQKLKLCGFDRAFISKSVLLNPHMGSTNYRAPEIILGYQRSESNIDVWSTGLVIFEMATKCQLFHGDTNNSVLYKILCVLGGIPEEMLCKCDYRSKHFKGKYFIRRTREHGERVYSKFEKSQIIPETIQSIYAKEWKRSRSVQEQIQDNIKLKGLQDFLEQMLVIYPKRRLLVDFLLNNSFMKCI